MRDDGRTLTADEWKALWGDEDKEPEGESYGLPKIYPGPRIRCPNCGYWQVGVELIIMESHIPTEANSVQAYL